jgi:hypothetical protein
MGSIVAAQNTCVREEKDNVSLCGGHEVEACDVCFDSNADVVDLVDLRDFKEVPST